MIILNSVRHVTKQYPVFSLFLQEIESFIIMIVRKHSAVSVKLMKRMICHMKQPTKTLQLYFFDFETKEDETGKMNPFYAIIQKVCRICD